MGDTPTGNRPGAPRKPTALKVLHGDFKTNPQRRNKNEPTVRGTVVAPDTLTPTALLLWNDLAPMLVRAGVLTPVDVALFAEFCEATVLVRLARLQVMREVTGQSEAKPGAASPFTNYAKAINVLTNLGGRFGLTPSDRARLVVPGADKPVDDLISSGG